MQDDQQLLDLMMRDQSKQGSLYRPGPHWIHHQKRIVKALRSQGLGQFRSVPEIGKGYSDAEVHDLVDLWPQGTIRTMAKKVMMELPVFKSAIDHYRTKYIKHKKRLAELRKFYYKVTYEDWFATLAKEHTIPETLHGGCAMSVELSGQEISTFYLHQLIRIHNFSPFCDFKDIQSVFEIGGGFGSNMHSLLTMYPNIRKVIYLDIPPVIYVATQYLRHFFPDAVKDYRDTRSNQKISFNDDDGREIICLCPWQLPKVEASIDLFWNAASFNEMPKDIVDNYGHLVTNLINRPNGKVALALGAPQDRPADGGRQGHTYGREILGAFEPTVTFEKAPLQIEAESLSRHYFGRVSNH